MKVVGVEVGETLEEVSQAPLREIGPCVAVEGQMDVVLHSWAPPMQDFWIEIAFVAFGLAKMLLDVFRECFEVSVFLSDELLSLLFRES